MIKIALASLFLAAVVPDSCNGNGFVLRESCAVLSKTMYVDGEFVLNAEERKSLRRQNKEKIANLIQFYQDKCAS